jgi:LysM repeat protein
VARVAVALCPALVVAACGGAAPAPPRAAVPTLPVVTATPGPPPIPTPGVQQHYVVQEGDTLSGIAARFGVSEDAIMKANGITEPDRIFVGQQLIVPPSQP